MAAPYRFRFRASALTLRAGLHSLRSCLRELLQKANVVLEEQLNVIDVVFQLCIPVDAATEGKACVLFSVIIHETIEIRMHHARAHDLDPSCSFAHPTAGAIAECAGDVYFCAGLDEGEKARPQ